MAEVSLQDITNINERLHEIEQNLLNNSINSQYNIKWEKLVKPGFGTKVIVNKYGLVTDIKSLESGDIPSIPMAKVEGLLKALANKEDKTDINDQLKEIGNGGTACKVTYNKYGEIVSGTDLSTEDIPTLQISKISSLEETLDSIISSIDALKVSTTDTFAVAPGTYAKITYDTKGRVIHGENLTMADIPAEISSTINTLQSSLLNYTPYELFESRLTDIDKKLAELTNPASSSSSESTESDNDNNTNTDYATKEDIEYVKDSLDDKVSSETYIDGINNLNSKIQNVQSMNNEITSLRNAVTELSKEFSTIKQTVNQLSTLVNNMNDEFSNRINKLENN